MSENEKSESITLVDLFAVLWKRKIMIIAVTVVSMVAVLVFSILSLKLPVEHNPLPNKYTASAQMLINDSSSDSGLSSMLSSSGLSSVASLAGVNVKGGSTYSALAGYLVSSNKTQDDVINQFNLIEKYKIKEHVKANSRKALSKVLTSSYDEDSGVFTVSFEDTDPEFAAKVANYVVSILERRFEDIGIDKSLQTKKNLEENIDTTYKNILALQSDISGIENSVSNLYSSGSAPSIMMDTSMTNMELSVQENIYSQLKAQYEMLKISMASEQPVFQILEYAEVPDQKSGPSRGKLCIIVTFAAVFLSVFLAFLLDALQNLKKDPETVSKFKKIK